MPKKFALLAFLVVAVLFQARASVEGRIEGTVTDKNGNPLEKVTVTIVSQKTATISYEVNTNKDGRFTQVGLMPGYYQVSFKKAGFMPKSTEARVSIAEGTKLEVKMDTAEAAVLQNLSAADQNFLKGNTLYEEKKYAEAASAYEEAIKLSQLNWGYYLNLGLSYKKLDKKDDALAAFKKAVELSPESYSANKEMGESLAQAGNWPEAKKYYQKAAEISPDDPDAQYNLGICLVNMAEPEAALASFQKTVQLKDDYAEAYYQMGTIYVGQNKVPEAVASLEKFLKLAPNHEKAALAKQLLEYLKK